MKRKKNEMVRIENLIKSDRMSVRDDFAELLVTDVDRVLRDYFDYKGLPKINVEKRNDGCYVDISLSVAFVKGFSSLPK